MAVRFPKISNKFLKSAEFKARQLWLNFEDVAGTVLQVLEPIKESAWLWFQKWKAGFRSKAVKPTKPYQLELPFSLHLTI